jgi:predicted transcriptional regulator
MATAKKPNKSQQIRAYIAKHPTAKAREVADALKLIPQYVHQVVHKMKGDAKIPTAVDTTTQITPERMKELVYEFTDGRDRRHPITGKRLMQGADIVTTHHTDMVNHPPHYKAGGIETIDFIEAKALGYHLGNVVKYVSRADHKGNKLEDLKKAQWYLSRAIEKLEI